jgi:predicted transposase YbfD/YdcC
MSTCEYYENKHGYQVNRRIELYENKIDLPKGWNGIQRFAKVRRWGTRDGKTFDETSFYVLSKPIHSAAIVAQGIQGHWSVENNLHWMKDVNLGEDNMSFKKPREAAILAYFNNIAINILANKGLKPTKNTFAKISNKVNELVMLFREN